jgi:hypothetical protein
MGDRLRKWLGIYSPTRVTIERAQREMEQLSEYIRQAEGALKMVDPEASPVLKYLKAGHHGSRLEFLNRPYADLAQVIEETLPKGVEKSVALRKLLESKDSAMRAAQDIPTLPSENTTSPPQMI